MQNLLNFSSFPAFSCKTNESVSLEIWALIKDTFINHLITTPTTYFTNWWYHNQYVFSLYLCVLSECVIIISIRYLLAYFWFPNNFLWKRSNQKYQDTILWKIIFLSVEVWSRDVKVIWKCHYTRHNYIK